MEIEGSEIRLLAKANPEAYGAGQLPCFLLETCSMELYDPQKHGAYTLPYKDMTLEGASMNSATRIKQLPLFFASRFVRDKVLVPRVEDCVALWDRYSMLDNIREHSQKVADLSFAMANYAREKNIAIMPEAVLAAGLLHDLGKTHSIAHGGDHAQIGASWVMRETRNAPIARAVLCHVYWSWENCLEECAKHEHLLLALLTIYADKRVMHDKYVSVDERYVDLLDRYGKNDHAKNRIEIARLQGKTIEAILSNRLGVKLDECTVDSGRLVKRT